MTQLEWHIIRNGLKINMVPPAYKPSWDGLMGEQRVKHPAHINNTRHLVKVYEEALGIEIRRKGEHMSTLAGAKIKRSK